MVFFFFVVWGGSQRQIIYRDVDIDRYYFEERQEEKWEKRWRSMIEPPLLLSSLLFFLLLSLLVISPRFLSFLPFSGVVVVVAVTGKDYGLLKGGLKLGIFPLSLDAWWGHNVVYPSLFLLPKFVACGVVSLAPSDSFKCYIMPPSRICIYYCHTYLIC